MAAWISGGAGGAKSGRSASGGGNSHPTSLRERHRSANEARPTRAKADSGLGMWLAAGCASRSLRSWLIA